MNDNEIIKALERCGIDRCDECPCYTEDSGCDHNLELLALDLINRQRAEIERWKKNCDELYEQMSDRQKAEVVIARRMGKAEAIKEFAERLKEKLYGFPTVYNSAFRGKIDNLVKEMTEGTE